MTVKTDVKGGVATVTLFRPEKGNALDSATRDALAQAISEVSSDPSVRAVVLCGAGKHFCTGGDLDALRGLDYAGALARQEGNHVVLRAMYDCPKPLIAGVDGVAAGAGVGLALACDVVVMSERSKLSLGFLKLGLVPDWNVAAALSDRVGIARARRMVLEAATINGAAAADMGLCDHLASGATAVELATGLAAQFAGLPPRAVMRAKSAFRQFPLDRAAALSLEAEMQAESLTDQEFRDALAAM